ncbi:DinB family protein [Streptomyces sp. NPDC057806]|uniref:DinB family protein n=1 Tax=Streptomyces sp. NPDC057806 TaxID=3346255 RepID=UPI00367D9B8B
MEISGIRTDRLGLLIDRFDRAREMAEVRLRGLGDEEYLWEPVPDCWSVRRRAEAVTPRAFGPGEWVLDRGAPDIPANEYEEVARQAAGGMSVAKIAEDWSVSVERVEEVLRFTGFWTLMDRWRNSVAALTDDQLDTVGLSQYPYGSDPDEPFVSVLWGSNLEFIHHMAEIGLLRDLWQARST